MLTTPTKRQQAAKNARRAFLDSFPTDEAKRQHFREIGRRSADGRTMLAAEDVRALSYIYATLTRIAQRYPKIAAAAPTPEQIAWYRRHDILAYLDTESDT